MARLESGYRNKMKCDSMKYFAMALIFTTFCVSSVLATEGTLPKTYEEDVNTIMMIRDDFKKIIDLGSSSENIFSAANKDQKRILRREEKEMLWSAWSSVLDYTITLDRIRGKYDKFNNIEDKVKRNREFAVYNECFLAQYRFALEFIDLVEKNPELDTVLNEHVPEMGLEKKGYMQFKFRFLNAARAAEYAAMQIFERIYGRGSGDLKRANKEDSAVIMKMGKGQGYILTQKNAVDIINKGTFAVWYPAQKQVSTWMGDTRVRRNETALISHDQIRAMQKKLEPGDILIERREWYLSNLGLPGFWTHAALYVGTPDERKKYFNTPDIQDWVRVQSVESGEFEDLLRTQYRDAHELSGKPDVKGNSYRVLEAVSEGVVFTSLEHTAEADSFAVLRPKLSKKEKALAVFKGFHYFGRPYDFNFDFLTDSSLVCSELVYKVYEPAKDRTGIRFLTERLMGRTLVTPNTMARQFAEENKTERQTDLVLFLDGYEKSGIAIEGDENVFRTTWHRPKWHIIYQDQLTVIEKRPKRSSD